jgi:transcriptional adapter 3
LLSQPDYTEKVDDPIATALRYAQEELRQVLSVNKARKTRLAAIARDRLGYQEYLDLRDNLDRNITALYAKLQKKDQPKPNKKRKKEGSSSNGARAGSEPPALPAPTAAALGLSPDDYHRLNVPEQLNLLVETRRKWVDHIGGQMAEIQAEQPGRVWGLPAKSIYEGIEDEVKKELLGLSQENKDNQVPSSSTAKGKEKAIMNEADMDLG